MNPLEQQVRAETEELLERVSETTERLERRRRRGERFERVFYAVAIVCYLAYLAGAGRGWELMGAFALAVAAAHALGRLGHGAD